MGYTIQLSPGMVEAHCHVIHKLFYHTQMTLYVFPHFQALHTLIHFHQLTVA